MSTGYVLPCEYIPLKYSITDVYAFVSGDGKIVVYTEDQGTWSATAQIDGAHGVCEVNHVCWASKSEDEEVLVSTGEDGSVKVWTV